MPGEQSGFLGAIDTAAIGRAAASLGAGRRRLEDTIDPAVGIELRVHLGDPLRIGEPIAVVHARSDGDAARAAAMLRAALTVEPARGEPPPLVHHAITP